MSQDCCPSSLLETLNISDSSHYTEPHTDTFHVPRCTSDNHRCNQRTLPSVDQLCKGVLPSFDSTSTLSPSLQALERRINPAPPTRSLSFFNRLRAVADFWASDSVTQLPRLRPQVSIAKLRERDDYCHKAYTESDNLSSSGMEVLVVPYPDGGLEGQQDDWLQYVSKLERADVRQGKDEQGRVQSVYQCRYEDDKGQVCNYHGLKQMVKRHVNSVHLKIRPWGCKFCSKRFPQKSSLQIHVNSLHTGSRPIKCLYCPDRFADILRAGISTLPVYMRINQ